MEKQKNVEPTKPPHVPYLPESTIGNQSYRKSLPPPGAAFALHLTEPAIGDHTLHIKIGEKAYDLFCKRGRIHGCDLDDWLEAEQMVLAELKELCNKRVSRRRQPAHRSQQRNPTKEK
jgi:hypothetical protein